MELKFRMRKYKSDDFRYIGLLIITNKKKVNDAQQPLNESMKYIFEDAELGNEQCNNGLLLAYIKDEKQVINSFTDKFSKGK